MKTFSVMTGLDLGAMAGGAPNASGNSEENMDTTDKVVPESTPASENAAPKQEESKTHDLNDMMEDDISDDDMVDPAAEEAKAQKEREAMAENEKASGTA